MSYVRTLRPRGLMLAGLLMTLLAAPSRAADPASENSLKLIPADAAFYTASLRNREQYEAVANSKAVARIKALPFVQKAWKEGFAELGKPGGAIEQFNAFRKDPENQALIDLFLDMMSTETFVYGDESLIQAIDLYIKVATVVRISALMPENFGKDKSEVVAGALFDALNANLNQIKIPDVVIGFRLSNTERAEGQIRRLEALVKGPLNQNPMTKGRLKRVSLGGKEFLSFTLDGSLIPMNQLQLDKYEKEQGQYDKLRKKLQSLTLNVSMGVRDQYMLLSIGSSTKHITKMGKGASLATRPEFKPLAKYAGKPLVELGYVSKALRSTFTPTKEDVDEYMKQAREALKNAEQIPEPIRKRLEKDLEELGKDVKSGIMEVGAISSFGFLTSNGMESLSYDFSEQRVRDGSKPLTLTQHLGGNPILCAVDRLKYDPESYAMLVKWLKTIYSYIDDFVVPQLNEQQKGSFEQVTKIAFPLLKRLDNATGKMLLPAFADGQNALVIDARWTAKKWFPDQPESAKPLPMLEIGMVVGVSDAEKLKKGFAEYRAVANDVLALAANFSQGQFPEIKIPDPKTKEIAGGTMYFYPIPPLPGLDKRVLPNAGLSQDLLVLTPHEEMTERLLSKKPLKTECTLLQDMNRPLAGMTYFNFAGLMDVLTPWVDFAIDQSGSESVKPRRPGPKPARPGPNDKDKASPKDKASSKDKAPPKDKPAPDDKPAPVRVDAEKEAIKKHAATIIEVLKCFRGAGTVWYVDGKAMVTHTETVIKDVK